MATYITQEHFNVYAASIALFSVLTGQTTREIMTGRMQSSLRAYSDAFLVDDIVLAADGAKKFFSEHFPKEALPGALRQMQFCSRHYNCDGTKKPRKFLKGLLFDREKAPLQNKVAQCLSEFLLYQVLTMKGVIPYPPEDWSL